MILAFLEKAESICAVLTNKVNQILENLAYISETIFFYMGLSVNEIKLKLKC